MGPRLQKDVDASDSQRVQLIPKGIWLSREKSRAAGRFASARGLLISDD
jgi:hypothetical protein